VLVKLTQNLGKYVPSKKGGASNRKLIDAPLKRRGKK
jgi:hypothetical protein